MDEFKKAHKKMFKNGFVENEYQQRIDDDDMISKSVTSSPSLSNNSNNKSTANTSIEVSKSEQQNKLEFSHICKLQQVE